MSLSLSVQIISCFKNVSNARETPTNEGEKQAVIDHSSDYWFDKCKFYWLGSIVQMAFIVLFYFSTSFAHYYLLGKSCDHAAFQMCSIICSMWCWFYYCIEYRTIPLYIEMDSAESFQQLYSWKPRIPHTNAFHIILIGNYFFFNNLQFL